MPIGVGPLLRVLNRARRPRFMASNLESALGDLDSWPGDSSARPLEPAAPSPQVVAPSLQVFAGLLLRTLMGLHALAELRRLLKDPPHGPFQ